MDEKQFILGALPSPQDKRDYKFAEAFPVIASTNGYPVEYMINLPCDLSSFVKNQMSVGSCVANSLAYTRELTEYQQSGQYKKFSVGYIYGNRENVDFQGEGMIPVQALRQLTKYGDVYEEDFPHNLPYPQVKQLILQRKSELDTKAYPSRISSYFRINYDDINEMKSAIMTLGALTCAFDIYDSFYNKRLNNILAIPDIENEKYLGGHMMTIIGWNRYNQWIVLNSYGNKWGNSGLCYVPFLYPISEVWAITDGILPNGDMLNIKYVASFTQRHDTKQKAEFIKTTMENAIRQRKVTDVVLKIIEDKDKYRIIIDKYFENREDAKKLVQMMETYSFTMEVFNIYESSLIKNYYKIVHKQIFKTKQEAENIIQSIQKFVTNNKLMVIQLGADYYIMFGEMDTKQKAEEFIKELGKQIGGIEKSLEVKYAEKNFK